MKKITTLLLASLFTGGSFSTIATERVDKGDVVSFIRGFSTTMNSNEIRMPIELWEGVFFNALCGVKNGQNNHEECIKDVKDQVMTLGLVCKSFCYTVVFPNHHSFNFITNSATTITPKKYLMISLSRILSQEELGNLFGETGFNVFGYCNIKLPVSGLSLDQLITLDNHPHLWGTLTGNNEFQLELKKPGVALPSSVKLITYSDTAKDALKGQGTGMMFGGISPDMLISQIDSQQPVQRDFLLNLVGQIKNFKIDSETVKELTVLSQAQAGYLIDKINSLDEPKVTAKSVRLLGEVDPSELDGFIKQLRVLKPNSLSLEVRIELLKAIRQVVDPSKLDDFLMYVSFIKGDVADFRSMILKLNKDIDFNQLEAFVVDLNRISEAKMYYFERSYNNVESIDNQLIDSLKKVSPYSERRTAFVTLLLEHLHGEKLDCKMLDKLAEINLRDLPVFLRQLQALKQISLGLEYKINCLKAVHHSERDNFVTHVPSITGPVSNYNSIMLKLKDIDFDDLGAFVADLNRITEAKMYYFEKSYGDYKNVESIDDQLIESLKKVSSSSEGRTAFVNLVVEHLKGEKLNCKMLDKLAEIPLRVLPAFLGQLQALKPISLSLEYKIDCLKAAHSSERDNFVSQVLSITGPVKDFRTVMLKLKDIDFDDLGAFVANLNRITEAKMYYFTQSYGDYKNIESIDDQLVESLKKVSSSSEGRTAFVNLVVEHLKGEKLDCKMLDKLAEIPLRVLPAFLGQLQALKPISLSLEYKIDCLKAAHFSERDNFVRHVSSITGPVKDFRTVMLKLKDIDFAELGAFVADLNRINEAKMYYFTQSYSFKSIESIDDQLIDSLKKVSRSPIGRMNFVTLLLTHLKGEKLDISAINKLCEIPLSKLEDALIQLKAMGSKESLYSRINKIDFNVLNTRTDIEENLIF